jgi:hypothetical protein
MLMVFRCMDWQQHNKQDFSEGRGITMRIWGLIAAIALVMSGCAQFQRSQVIDTDKLGGYASGTYKEDSSGPMGNFALLGTGAGWGGGGGGFGIGGIAGKTGPAASDAYNFARAIAMINYSKKLKSVKYDEYGGVIDYEFEQTPSSSMSTAFPGTRSKLPSSFGHQPIE